MASPSVVSAPEERVSDTFRVVIGILLICVLDYLGGLEIDYGTVSTAETSRALHFVDGAGEWMFLLVAVICIIAAFAKRRIIVYRAFVVYLVVATIQVLVNIGALIGTAGIRNDSYLWGLYDVLVVYMMIVAVFTGWYWVSDVLTPGGAFDFPQRAEGPEMTPGLIDYVFIAFNTNATFGPTSESVMARKVKVLMMIQTACSLCILLIFIARLVSLKHG